MYCPICSSVDISGSGYNYHRLSFAPLHFRQPFSNKRPVSVCKQCGHLWSDSGCISADKFSQPESFHHPRYNLDESQIQTERLFSQYLIEELGNENIGSSGTILDLRMLSGRVLAEVGQAFNAETLVGFDMYSVNCEWAKEQYGHQVAQYPVGDPVEYLADWISQNTNYLGKVDLILQSQSILALTRQPSRFVDLILRLLRPDGIWGTYEQFVDLFPPEVLLHELFDPWAMQYFSQNSFLRLFSDKPVRIDPRLNSTTRCVHFLRPSEGGYVPTTVAGDNILQKHPRITKALIERAWYGPYGRMKAIAKSCFYKLDERLLLTRPSRYFGSPECRVSHFPNVIDHRPVVDVLVVSCGRLSALQRTIKHFLKMCHSSSHKYRFLIHDDWIETRAPQHRECRDWIRNLGLFDEVHFADENRGISRSVNLLLSRIQSDLYVHLEDDMVFVRPVDFDPLYNIFYDFPKVNQIRFNRAQTTPTIGSVSKIFGKYRARMFKFNDTILTMASLWSNQAQIARSNSPFTHLMATVDGRFHERVFNIEFAKNWLDPFDSYTHLGTFMYGPVGAAKVVYESGNISPHSIIQRTFPEDNTLTIDRFRK
jgi:hypothetical protein